MSRIRIVLVGTVVATLAATALSLFQVDTTEYAIVTQFGKPMQVLTEPGLYFKLPEPVQTVTRLNRRLQIHTLPEAEFLTRDKKNVLVETFATWQVTEPLQFFKSVRDPVGANTRLSDILASELGAALGRYELANLVTTEADAVQLPAMMQQVAAQAGARTTAYGFTVTDVSLKSINFPQANRQSVFQRMKAERERIARQFRSEGTEEATKSRADADAQRTTILSGAEREAERTRGEGEAEAIRIYADAFGKAPDFYEFLRTLQAYEKVINSGTTLILPADSQLLKYLEDGGRTVASSSLQAAQPQSR